METKSLILHYGIIYKCTNLINGKIYIGQTIKSLNHRIGIHFAIAKINKGYYFHNSIRKYGEKNFRWEKIDSASSKSELDYKEIFYITLFNSLNNKFGYNLKSGGSCGNPYAGKSKEEMDAISLQKSISITKAKKLRTDLFVENWKKNLSTSKKSRTEEEKLVTKQKKLQANANRTDEEKRITQEKFHNSLSNRTEEQKLHTRTVLSEQKKGINHPFYGKKRPDHAKK